MEAPQPTLASLMQALDNAISRQLFQDGTQEAIDAAYQAVLAHPDNKMSLEVLQYRTRSLFY